MFKSYTLSVEQSGVIVPGQGTGTLKIDEASGQAIIDFGTETLALLMASAAVSAADIVAATITKQKLAGGFSKVSVVDGEDETSTNQITVSGMATGDEVAAVIVFTAKATIVTAAAHAGTLTAGTGKITPGTKVNNSGNQYIVFWNDLT